VREKRAIVRQAHRAGPVSYEGPFTEREAVARLGDARAASENGEGGAILPSIVREGDAEWPLAAAAITASRRRGGSRRLTRP
jgi:hypothetical protein